MICYLKDVIELCPGQKDGVGATRKNKNNEHRARATYATKVDSIRIETRRLSQPTFKTSLISSVQLIRYEATSNLFLDSV